MAELGLSYIALFALAILAGFAAGWTLRRFVVDGQLRDLDGEIDDLRAAVERVRRERDLVGGR